MNENMMKINNKLVQLRQPYKAPIIDVVGREEEIKTIIAAWISGKDRLPLSPLLLGEAGVGKNRIVYECAKICGKDLYAEQGHEDLTPEDLICSVRFSDDPDKKMDYILSNLSTALVQGGIFFLDGIAKMRSRALSPLESVLDERRYIDSSILGERIVAHPGFRFIAATNPEDMDENRLPDFIKSRIRPLIHFGYPDLEDTNRIIQTHYPVLSNNGSALLDCFWKLWRVRNGDKPPVPRDSIKIFGFAQNLADFEAMENTDFFILENHGVSPAIKEKHMVRAFDVFF